MKKLLRSNSDKQIAGVCGGIGEYFDIDPNIIRAGYILITIISGLLPGVIAYLILAVIIPTKSEVKNDGKKIKQT
ncbi:PspC domain-containing protein [Candidatus Saccharibacteria bacterium]|nr:PspC domain-containing protein [Candidatus Saccharibacteria bacterium]